ncbi:MAG TPA: extracellular solute-binding protein [Clostridiales bacterium]|jgi:hypothetical protein|nr:extracellular solute-binding protein [Clostridiales bacterium]
MKKLIALLLCLMLTLPTFATEPPSLTIPSEHEEIWVQTFPFMGGMLCRLDSDKTYYYLNPEGTELRPLTANEPKASDLEEGARYFQFVDIVEDAGKSYAIFTTETNMYVLPLELSGDTLSFGDKVKMDCEHRVQYYDDSSENGQSSYLMTGDRHILMGDTLYASQYDMEGGRELDSFNVLTGEYTPCAVEKMMDIVPYKDGNLLMIQPEGEDMYADDAVFVVSILNLDDFSTEEFAKLGPNFQRYSNDRIFYEEATDSLLYSNNMQIYRLHRNGEEELCGYKTSKYMQLTMLGSGQLAGTAQAKVQVISTDGSNLPTAELRMYHVYGDEKVRASLNDVMFVEVEEYQDGIALGQALVSGALQVDVLSLYSDYNTPAPLVEKGYLADLQDVPGVKEYMDSLYPFLSEPFTKDGAIYAIPLHLQSDTFGYSPSVMKELGYEAPKTFAEFCDIINDYLENHTDDNEYALFDSPVSGQWFLSFMVKLYLNTRLQMNLPLALDTPEFREMLAAYESLPASFRNPEPQELSEEEWMEMMEKKMLFNTYSETSPIGISYVMNEIKAGREQSYSTLPLMLSPWEGAPTAMAFSTEYLCVFAQSPNMDNAKRYIEESVQNIRKENLASLVKDYSEPLENEYYEQSIRSTQEYMNTLKEELDKAEGAEKTQLEKEYEQAQKNLQFHQEYGRYLVSLEALEYYQNTVMVAPVLNTGHPLLSWDSPLAELSERYFGGQISMDQLIKEFDQKAKLITLERQ